MTVEVPAGQYKGMIPNGPRGYAPCGPCSLAALQEWEKLPKRDRPARPNVRGVRRSEIRNHLRAVHGVNLKGEELRYRNRRQGCTHAFVKSQRCDRCGVTQRDIVARVKR